MGSSRTDNREVVLERFVVQLNGKTQTVHYVALGAMTTVCGVYVPPVPSGSIDIIMDGKEKDQDHPLHCCANCKAVIERRANEGRVVRLARLKEKKYAA